MGQTNYHKINIWVQEPGVCPRSSRWGSLLELLCKAVCIRAMPRCEDYSALPAVTRSLTLSPSVSTIRVQVYFPFQAASKEAKLNKD